APRKSWNRLSGVDREALAQVDGLRLHLLLDGAVSGFTVGGKAFQNFGDHAADLLELRDAEAACGAGGRAEADARGDHRLLRIERNAILVAGDVRALQSLLGDVAGQLLGAQVDQD